MKALVIADNEKIIERIGESLKKFGYDVIVYRWLLKALDNIAEIAPHLIAISAEDYPRHWKTLSQFCGEGEASKVILYRGENFSEEEKKKADALGIFGSFSSVDEFRELDELLTMFQPSPDVAVDFSKVEVEPLVNENENCAPLEEENENEEEQKIENCSFVFTNPVTLALVSGQARNFNGKTLDFTPDIADFIKTLFAETQIKNATIKTSRGIRQTQAYVVSNDGSSLVLRIA